MEIWIIKQKPRFPIENKLLSLKKNHSGTQYQESQSELHRYSKDDEDFILL